ncbi:hypothetical protein KGF54_001924 [Candida jiufengensis]|uniref:uncharacterized protein n=1 Tax=Candida jiufengensis TaxID=497108 RepID=UPI0022240792|nr:uncharacterized protein KGF54_001924 [Candida jiufengensis]KAI5955363.1 hypothetical protein KGF54_001924 [Candida jiufengensis]
MSSNESGFTGTGTGGDVFQVDLNQQFQQGDMVWIAIAAVIVWLMIPGVGLLYSGLSRKKHALSLMWAALMSACVTTFQWFFWGYSLIFAHNGSQFIGTLQNFCLKDVLGAPAVASTLPDILFCFYQGMFAAVTGILMVGAGCERARLAPMMIFLFIWLTIVYAPVAYWTWGGNGWLANLGSLDFAGGGPVHENSGFSALAYSLWLGKRHDPVAQGKVPKYKPHSVSSIVLGTCFLWFGWFGFNGGSTGNANMRSWYACVNTNLAAASGGLTWMFIDYFRTGGKWSVVGLCTGAIAGLIGITPAAGLVPVYTSLIFGIIPAIICNFAVDLKAYIGIDDGMDVWALHGVGGFVGNILTGIFAADYVAMIDGVEIDGGWINGNWKQIGYQFAGSISVAAWSFIVTSIILLIMDRIPFLKLRLKEEEEMLGTDLVQIGEFAYYDDNQDPETSPYLLEPVRSTEALKEKLKATTSRKQEGVVETVAEEIDGVATTSDDHDESLDSETKK